MSDPEVIELNSPGVEVFAFGPAELGTVDVVGPPGGDDGPGAHYLDDLLDVAGTTDGSPGQALVKGGDGIWIPQAVGGGSGQSYFHVQESPSTVWLIGHGMGFNPAGIDVYDQNGDVYYPDIEYVDIFTVRLTFGDTVRGNAYLS